jgi:outer membrane protein assembly factor BamB
MIIGIVFRALAPAVIVGMVMAAWACPAEAGVSNGWRGNGTGLWPDAHPPLEWHRIPKGALPGLRAQINRPGERDEPARDSALLENGLMPNWLAIGPFQVTDSVKNFNDAQLPGEADVQPSEGDKAGDLTWKKMAGTLDDRFAFGPANLPWTDLGGAVGGAHANQVAYAHTYLHSLKGGKVHAVVDHMFGMKAWLNGKAVYQSSERKVSLGSYYGFSRVEFGTDTISPSPHFDLDLRPGWNRLLLKLSTLNREDKSWNQQNFCLRLMDPATVGYDSKNVLWMTELPQRSNATPIVVGDRIFVMAEPDELLCLDKHTGRILWTAANSYYAALSPDERQANPAFQTKVDTLLVKLRDETDLARRIGLRTSIQKQLTEIDSERFAYKADGHFEAHFGIVGFTTPTPLSDGKHVWVWCGNGVAACYDLDGKRRWITRVNTRELSYASSPALADGTLAVFLNRLVGLDAQTGKVRWEQKKINANAGAILAARIAGTEVFISSMGDVVRAADGKILYRERDRAGGGSSWAPPVILGDVVYLPRYGVKHLLVLDFAGADGEAWEPKRAEMGVPDGTGRLPNGKMVDRPTCGSPLVVDDLAYMVDIYSTLYVFDLKARKMLYLHDTELRGLFHYNAVPVASSPTLIGKQIVIQDNQGTALVLEPGRTFRQVSRNRIATQLDRWWPVPAQETVGYSPPVPDGRRIYIRGERYLYCLGEK